VETVAVVASNLERARLYLRYRPVRCAVGADPGLTTHRAYGVPRTEPTAEVFEAIAVPDDGSAVPVVDRLDGFETTESEVSEFQQHQIQFTAQYLLDRDGVVRWANVECSRDGLAGLDKFPSDGELVAAARALVR
jgi:hypothetical protein